MMSSLPLPIAAFCAGSISFLGPCVLPLVPGYVSLVSGAGAEQLKQADRRLMRSVMLSSLMFILGFTLVFMAMGAVASSIGQLVQRHIALLTRIAGVIIVVFGLHMTGLVPIKALYADKHLHGIAGGSTAGRAFLVGFAFAFGWTPCVGPILAVILTFAASEDTVLKGAGLLAIYSMGLAVPFLLTSLGIDRFLALYGKFRRHLHRLEVASGVTLMIVGALIFTRHFTLINAWLNRIPFFRDMAEKFF